MGKPEKKIKTTPVGGNHLVESEGHRGSWQRVEVETVQPTGQQPYSATFRSYHITFEGGVPSADPGWDLVRRGFDRREVVEPIIRALVGNWEWDATLEEDPERPKIPWHAERLEKLVQIADDVKSVTWQVTFRQPYLD